MEQVDKTLQFWKSIQSSLPYVTAVVGAVVAAIFFFITNHVAENRINRLEKQIEEAEERKEALSGTITSKIIPGKNQVSILFGQSSVSVDINTLRNGRAIKPLSFIGGYNITLKLRNEQILLSADFVSLDGKIVAQIIDNEWQVNRNNYFDRNYDENGLEVIDQDKITKFQIDFSDIYNIRLGGSFIAGNSLCTFHPNGTTTVIGLTDKKEKLIEMSGKVETMFRYPSKNFFGIRTNSQIKFNLNLQPNIVIVDPTTQNLEPTSINSLVDDYQIIGLEFGGIISNQGPLPIKLINVKLDIYIDKTFYQRIVPSEGYSIMTMDTAVIRSNVIYFDSSRNSISFSRLRELKIRWYIEVEFSDFESRNVQTLIKKYESSFKNNGVLHTTID